MTEGRREPGYRGSLPPRQDRLARAWVLAVIGILVLVFVLSAAGLPSRFFPEPTLVPLPSAPLPSFSLPPGATGGPSPSSEASPLPSG